MPDFPLSKLKYKKNNPRTISPEDLEKLKASIQDFPKMMKYRPMVYDPETMEVLGGNQRLKALRELGFKAVPEEWVKSAADLTEEERRRFVAQDNMTAGKWNTAILKDFYTLDEVNAWGLDLPSWDSEPVSDFAPGGAGEELDPEEYAGSNKEIDTDDFEDRCALVLNYTLEEYETVRQELAKVAQTPEQAVWVLLGLEKQEE